MIYEKIYPVKHSYRTPSCNVFFWCQKEIYYSNTSTIYGNDPYFSDRYHKNPKILDTRKFAVITLKVEQDGFSLE